jgi:hypothetical protein
MRLLVFPCNTHYDVEEEEKVQLLEKGKEIMISDAMKNKVMVSLTFD